MFEAALFSFSFPCPQTCSVQSAGLPGGPVAAGAGLCPSAQGGGSRSGAWGSRCGGFSCCDTRASVVVEHRLSCCTACGACPAQGLNPCPLQGQADSYFHLTTREVKLLLVVSFFAGGGGFSTVFQSRRLDTTLWP